MGGFVPPSATARLLVVLTIAMAPALAQDRPQPPADVAPRVDFEERVSLVNVYATVRDKRGEFVRDLAPGDFEIFEDGVAQSITHFAVEDLPLNVVLLVDTSGSMSSKKLDTAQKAAKRFLRTLEFPRDRAMVVAITDRPEIVQGWSSDIELLSGVIGGLEASGTTALYDSILVGVDELRGLDGRRVIILLSDGLDRPGSTVTFDYALEQAKRASVMIYSIGLGRFLWAAYDMMGERSAQQLLTRLAEETGGAPFFATRAGQLKRAYIQVAEELEHQYGLGYVSTNLARDGAWRKIRLSVDGGRGTAYHRPGYYAPED